MSDHGHDSHHEHDHGSHDHGGHDHGSHGHDDHSHGHDDHGHGHDDHGHGHEHYGDYNAKPLPPSTLPPVNSLWLSVFGLALSSLLAAIVIYSVGLSERSQQVHGSDAHDAAHGKHDDAHHSKDAHGKH